MYLFSFATPSTRICYKHPQGLQGRGWRLGWAPIPLNTLLQASTLGSCFGSHVANSVFLSPGCHRTKVLVKYRQHCSVWEKLWFVHLPDLDASGIRWYWCGSLFRISHVWAHVEVDVVAPIQDVWLVAILLPWQQFSLRPRSREGGPCHGVAEGVRLRGGCGEGKGKHYEEENSPKQGQNPGCFLQRHLIWSAIKRFLKSLIKNIWMWFNN